MQFSELTPEQQEKARACKTPEELLTLAKSEGIELSEDLVESISGGSWSPSDIKCNSYCDDAPIIW